MEKTDLDLSRKKEIPITSGFRSLILFMVVLSVIFSSGCSTRSTPLSVNAPLTNEDNIQTNQSVNLAWGGAMCEAGGLIYYCAENPDQTQCVMRMSPDGSNQEPFTRNYNAVYSLASDGEMLYFQTDDALYRMPLSGGEAHKIADGEFWSFQIYDGKIYCALSDEDILICMNSDGTEKKEIKFANSYQFLATENGLYFTRGNADGTKRDIYKSDLNGENIQRVTKKSYAFIDQIFYEQGSLYFLVPNDFSGWFWADDLDFTDVVYKIDANGKQSVVLKHIGYYSQDYSTLAYCGVSGDDFYYFNFSQNASDDSVGEMDLHRYNMKNNTDAVILKNVEMVDPSPRLLRSVRGKEIDSKCTYGFYILGNDIYFMPPELS